ncbi:MAG: hypothetical protein RR998_10095 [Oscillospiraceae bacterium]
MIEEHTEVYALDLSDIAEKRLAVSNPKSDIHIEFKFCGATMEDAYSNILSVYG